ncbi:hypothetical protein ACFSQ7_42205 [Paenibacillus rhizoplanae]
MGRVQDTTPSLQHILQEFDQCADLSRRNFPEIRVDIVYFPHLVSSKLLTDEILEPFARPQGDKIEQLLEQSQFVFFRRM